MSIQEREIILVDLLAHHQLVDLLLILVVLVLVLVISVILLVLDSDQEGTLDRIVLLLVM